MTALLALLAYAVVALVVMRCTYIRHERQRLRGEVSQLPVSRLHASSCGLILFDGFCDCFRGHVFPLFRDEYGRCRPWLRAFFWPLFAPGLLVYRLTHPTVRLPDYDRIRELENLK